MHKTIKEKNIALFHNMFSILSCKSTKIKELVFVICILTTVVLNEILNTINEIEIKVENLK